MATLDCGSSSCWFSLEKGGQRNNGPCRCLREIPQGLRSVIIMTLQAKVNAETKRCEKIADERTRYSPHTPGPQDIAWKDAALVIRDRIHEGK